MNQYRVRFKYADAMSNWKWNEQECSLYGDSITEAIERCVNLYGLGVDCQYQIIEVKEVR